MKWSSRCFRISVKYLTQHKFLIQTTMNVFVNETPLNNKRIRFGEVQTKVAKSFLSNLWNTYLNVAYEIKTCRRLLARFYLEVHENFVKQRFIYVCLCVCMCLCVHAEVVHARTRKRGGVKICVHTVWMTPCVNHRIFTKYAAVRLNMWTNIKISSRMFQTWAEQLSQGVTCLHHMTLTKYAAARLNMRPYTWKIWLYV